VTFEEEAKCWKKRWQEAEWACEEIAVKVKKLWRGIYEEEIEEEVDRRMKKGKPRGKDKGVQASTPPVTVSPAGTQTGKVRRREGGGGEEEREGSQVEEEDKVMKGDRMTPGSTGDHTRTCPATRMRTRLWWHYPPKYRSHHIQRHQNRLTENPGQPRQPPRTSPLAIPEPRG